MQRVFADNIALSFVKSISHDLHGVIRMLEWSASEAMSNRSTICGGGCPKEEGRLRRR